MQEQYGAFKVRSKRIERAEQSFKPKTEGVYKRRFLKSGGNWDPGLWSTQ